MNLLEALKSNAGDALKEFAATVPGESRDSTATGVNTILAVLTAAMIRKGNTEERAGRLLDFLRDSGFDGSALPGYGRMLAEEQGRASLIKSGGQVLQYLVGDRLSALTDLISRGSGMMSDTAGNLMKSASVALMHVLGREVQSGALNAAGLRNMLSAQRDTVIAELPPGLAAIPGFALQEVAVEANGDPAPEQAVEIVDAVDRTVVEKPLVSRLLPWLMLLLASLALLFFLGRGCGGSVPDTAPRYIGEAPPVDEEQVTVNVTGVPAQITLPDGMTIETHQGSFITGMAEALSAGELGPNTAFVMDGVSFEPGSADLTAVAAEQLDKLVALLDAYPGVRLRIEAHTDNTGSATDNMSLSEQQARTIVQFLQAHGITADRLSGTGRGQTKPIAPNDTAEGRAKNRRVEVYVQM